MAAESGDAPAACPPREGPLVAIFGRVGGGLLGKVLAAVYGRVVARRNRAFDRGAGVVRLDRPVVSIGNLSVGGTGKTPMVARLVAELRSDGRSPVIAMRGYKGNANAAGESDEAAEYSRLLPDVPVVSQPDRAAGLRALFSTERGGRIDCIVLDDGFQHRRIHRDVDIVLIDATAGTPGDRLLPAGWLREPWSALARAHAVVITHAEAGRRGEIERIREAACRVNPALPVAVCRHIWDGLREGAGEKDLAMRPVEWLRGRRVAVLCAIGNPAAFLEGIREAGAEIILSRILRDHDPLAEATVREAAAAARAAGADAVLTTEKDWSKLRHTRVEWGRPVLRPALGLRFDEGWEEITRLVRQAVGSAGGPPILSVDTAGALGTGAGAAARAR